MPFTWSYSRLKNFETCPKRHWHYDIAKDFKDDGGQMNEGQDGHKAFDARIRSNKPLPLGLLQHEPMMAKLASMGGETYSELKLALTKDYQASGYFDDRVWFRTVVDFCNVKNDAATILDYKFGKPTPDMTQLQLMSATVMHYMPVLKRVRARLLFVNHNKVEGAEFSPGDLASIWAGILPRVMKLQMAVETNDFPPTPNGLCKRWCGVTECPYHGRGTG